MEREAYRIDPFSDVPGTGVLGRMLDVLQSKNMTVGPISIDKRSVVLNGSPDIGRSVDVIPRRGPSTLYDDDFKDSHDALNAETTTSSGIFAELWSQNLIDVRSKSEQLSGYFSTKSSSYVDCCQRSFPDDIGRGGIIEQMRTVARMIAARDERGVDRDAFYVSLGGFDSHADLVKNLRILLPEVNKAVASFRKEMEEQNMLDKVTFVQMSDFGRTITPNSGSGSDHGKYASPSGGIIYVTQYLVSIAFSHTINISIITSYYKGGEVITLRGAAR